MSQSNREQTPENPHLKTLYQVPGLETFTKVNVMKDKEAGTL
jgi:hypothetical protein